MSINGQGHSLTLVKGHSDFKVKCLTFGLYTQVSNSGPLGPLVECSRIKSNEIKIKSIYMYIVINNSNIPEYIANHSVHTGQVLALYIPKKIKIKEMPQFGYLKFYRLFSAEYSM